jgi:actin-like ATPase involved in cell morphogenesis
MRYGVGIDLGTSFTTVAVHGPDGTRMVPLSPEVVVPSVAYATPEGALLTGTAAQNAALVGDAGSGRVARGFKRRLGDPTPLMLGGAAYSPAALMAAQLRDVIAHVTRAEGGPPETVVLTCPAVWGQYRREHFEEVPRLAGVPVSRLVTEPEAAATHYSVERRLGDGEVVAVYDLGGGTFDTTILRMRSGGMEILGTPDGIEHMGGIDFDETLLSHVDQRLGGAVGALDRADPVSVAALAEIRAMCVRAKEELSTEPDVVLTVPLPSGPREVSVTRLEFNDMIRPSVRLTTDALRRTISSAGLRPEDLSAVLLAGGSARIPLVAQLVSEEFGKPVWATLHPKFTVALGAAAISGQAPAPATDVIAPVSPPDGVPVPPPVSPPGGVPVAAAPPAGRRKWLVPAVAAALAVLVAAVTTVVLTSGDPEPRLAEPKANTSTETTTTTTPTTTTTAAPSGASAPSTLILTQTQPPQAPTTQAAPPPPQPPTLWVYDNGPVSPYHSLIASDDNWGGKDLGVGAGSQSVINAAPDGAGGLRVTWAGGAPAQIYLQDVSDAEDFSSYMAGGALVFDMVVHTPPADRVTVGVHCKYPCVSDVNATTVFRGLPAGQKATVTIPLSCFVARGLNPAKVNTPFLVYTGAVFDATFSDVRWEPNAATAPGATPCSALN